MKKFTIAPIATVVMLGLSGTAFAHNHGNDGDNDKTGIDIYKKVNITNNIDYEGKARISGSIGINKLGMALINNAQGTTQNNVVNFRNDNNARISDNSGNHLTGNSGVNVAAGDNNVQSNNAAITVLGKVKGKTEEDPSTEPSFSKSSNQNDYGVHHGGKGASVDAEIASMQVSAGNNVINDGNHNNSKISDNALNHSAGNLGVNVTSGSGNVQANNFAVSYGKEAHLAVSTVDNQQATGGNNTTNTTLMAEDVEKVVKVTMKGNVSGDYKGTSKQSNDVYPEIWYGGSVNTPHPDGDQYAGHIDFDDKNPNKPGRFEFKDKGTVDLGEVSLSGKVVTYNTVVGRTNVNNAIMSGNTLNHAAGNVGVNVSAGTNNLQSNSLALSSANF